MGFLQRIFSRPETRDANVPFAAAFSVLPTRSGHYVNPRIAENMATVTACVGAISSALATLPAIVYLRADAGRIEATNHPIARLTRQPNANQTWPDVIEQIAASALLFGNAIAVLDYDGAGRVTSFTPLPWPSVSMRRLPSGRIAYDVVSGAGPMRRYFADQVFHLKDRSDDGLVGRSRISRAPDVIGNAAALQDWSGSLWQNQATPSGAVKLEKSINKDQLEGLRAQFEGSFSGTRNARRVLILDNNASWQPLSVSPEDAEVLASRRFTVEELCRLFQVPPPIVQDYTHNTFTNSAQAALWFAQFSLTPWARKIEAEFARSVFGPSSNFEIEIDLSGLMRGDFATRWQAYAVARQNDILTVNEIREQEGYGPLANDAMVSNDG